MTDLDLAAIRQRADAATNGPWTTDGATDEYKSVAGPMTVRNGLVRMHYIASDLDDFNAEFIAAARTDVPALLAEVERLQRENARLTEGHTRIAADAFKLLSSGDDLWRQVQDLKSDMQALPEKIAAAIEADQQVYTSRQDWKAINYNAGLLHAADTARSFAAQSEGADS